jgi:hypothetical protein
VTTNRRIELLFDLVQRRRPVEETLGMLQEYPWDSEPLVELLAGNISATLLEFVNGTVSAEYVHDWADALEVREDIGVTSPRHQEILFELANPMLVGELDVERAQRMLRNLR